MIREHFSNRTKAPQPQLLIVAMLWIITLLCWKNGPQPQWARYMVAIASILTVYIAVRFWLYFGKHKTR